MRPLTLELASTVFRQTQAWFGPPALLRANPRDCAAGDVFDGHLRRTALQLVRAEDIWHQGRFPFRVFSDGVRDDQNGELLARALVLTGHHGRAWFHIPELFRTSALDIQNYLGISFVDAVGVYCEAKALRQLAKREQRRNPRRTENARRLDRIRSLLAAHFSGEAVCDLESIARIIEQ